MAAKVSYDHLEEVSKESWKVHEDSLRDKRELYLKMFMDNRWENEESDKVGRRMQAERRKREIEVEEERRQQRQEQQAQEQQATEQ